jgi:hypothetical protein
VGGACGRKEMHVELWCENPLKRQPGRPEDGNILKWILRQRGLRVWNVLMWFRTRKSGGLL